MFEVGQTVVCSGDEVDGTRVTWMGARSTSTTTQVVKVNAVNSRLFSEQFPESANVSLVTLSDGTVFAQPVSMDGGAIEPVEKMPTDYSYFTASSVAATVLALVATCCANSATVDDERETYNFTSATCAILACATGVVSVVGARL